MDILKLDIPNYFLFFAAFVNILLAATIIFNSRKRNSESLFSLTAFASAMWCCGMFLYRAIPNSQISLFWAKFYYLAATIITASFLLFVLIFPEKISLNNLKKNVLVIFVSLIFVVFSLIPGLIVEKVDFNLMKENDIYFGQGLFLWGLYLLTFFIFAFLVLIKKYYNSKGNLILRKQYLYIIIGSYISIIIGIVTNHVLPFFFNNPNYAWLGPTSTIIMVSIITFAILRQNLFNVKLITTQLFVFALWIFLLIRAFVSSSTIDQLLNWGLLIATIIIGVFLIRSVLNEVSQREKIEKLARDLSKANDQLTVANAKLKELDRQKTEFVSISSHQLRTPLTAIKGYSSMLMEGSYGEVPEGIRNPIQIIFESSQRMVKVIEDFLTITRIELGKIKYEITEFDLAETTEKVVTELMLIAKNKNLPIIWHRPAGQFKIKADYGKISQVIGNLIDNAVKYTEKGKVEVFLKREKDKMRIEVYDQGIGMDTETINKLFEKFVRADGAGKVNFSGTGLGLYVARQIVEAHGGKIWAESEGAGRGSSFIVELPDKITEAKRQKLEEFAESL